MGGEGGGVFLEGFSVRSFLRGRGVFGQTRCTGCGGGGGGDLDGETASVFEDAFKQRGGGGPAVIVLAVENEGFEFGGRGVHRGGERERAGKEEEARG